MPTIRKRPWLTRPATVTAAVAALLASLAGPTERAYEHSLLVKTDSPPFASWEPPPPLRQWYPAALAQLHVDPTLSPAGRGFPEAYRLYVDGSLLRLNPTVVWVTVNQSGSGSLTISTLDRPDTMGPAGRLLHRTLQLTPKQVSALRHAVDSCGFWKLGESLRENPLTVDGSMEVLEARQGTRYHAVRRADEAQVSLSRPVELLLRWANETPQNQLRRQHDSGL